MPSVSERQRRFMMAEMTRAKHGKRTKTGMSMAQLADYTHVQTPRKGAILHGEKHG